MARRDEVSASSGNSQETLTTKSGPVFALCAPNGDIDPSLNGAHGVYFHDTRYLNRASLLVNGQRLTVLLANADQTDRSISELTNPQLQLESGELDSQRLGFRRERRLSRTVSEELTIQNFALRDVGVTVELEYASSFDDIFVVRGAPRGKRGRLRRPRWHGSSLRFGYDGADGRRRRLELGFDPVPTRKSSCKATYELRLPAQAETTIRVTGSLRDEGGGSLEVNPTRPASGYLNHTTVDTDNQLFNIVLDRSFEDLRMLLTRQRGDTFFAAGVPWFVALFGRDSLITALEMLAYDSRVAANTLQRLARYQGRRDDPRTQEQPGRILHELRVGEMANLDEVPYRPYYGTADATPLFIVLLGEYVRWTADTRLWARLKGNVERALEWIDRCADHGLGFTSYMGPPNMGWKDSGNSIVDSKGDLARSPIALVEVQGYVYWAKRNAAELFDLDGDTATAERLRSEADTLRRAFDRAFWQKSQSYYALALAAGGRPIDSVSSNPGQALLSGIVPRKRVAAVARKLMDGSMFSGWGVRTLAGGEAAYNPIDYQVGAVWPHDNALIAAGLKRSGRPEDASKILTGVFQAASLFPQYRLPEVFAGFSRSSYGTPVDYPVACSPQAWASGALPYMLAETLGLQADAIAGVLNISAPRLPDWLATVNIRNLRVGRANVDLRFERSGSRTLATVIGQRGKLMVNFESKQRE